MLSAYRGNASASSPQASNKPILISLEDPIPGAPQAPIAIAFADSPYTIADAEFIGIRTFLINSSGGDIVFNLPATPIDGEIINVKRVTTDGNDLTIDGNGENIEGAAADIVDTNITLVNYQLQFSASGWWIL